MSVERLITPDQADGDICDALNLFIGRGRKWSTHDVAAGTGIPERTIQGWLSRTPEDHRRIPGASLLVLMQFLGIEFTNRVLAIIGLGIRNLEPDEGEPAVIVARLLEYITKFAAHGVDGEFCRTDRKALAPIARAAIAILTPFAEEPK